MSPVYTNKKTHQLKTLGSKLGSHFSLTLAIEAMENDEVYNAGRETSCTEERATKPSPAREDHSLISRNLFSWQLGHP